MESTRSTAFGAGDVSFGLHLHDGVPPRTGVLKFLEQAKRAEDVGFAGLTVSEHHAGYPGYLPAPVLAASWLLGATSRSWVAPCPVLLPLRPAGILMEEVAWLEAAHPGRVGLGIAPGYVESDFAVAGVPFAERRRIFDREMAEWDRVRRGGEHPASSDRAIAAGALASIPVVSAAGGPVAARRAASAGGGLIFGPNTSEALSDEMVSIYRDHGGDGALIYIKRVWVGTDAPVEALREQLAAYHRSAGATPPWLAEFDTSLVHGEADAVAHELGRLRQHQPGALLNLRIHGPGIGPDAVARQLDLLGSSVLPQLK